VNIQKIRRNFGKNLSRKLSEFLRFYLMFTGRTYYTCRQFQQFHLYIHRRMEECHPCCRWMEL